MSGMDVASGELVKDNIDGAKGSESAVNALVSHDIDCDTGMTSDEQQCLDSVVDAWNKFVNLERQHPDELRDFADSVHRIQGILTTRIARRLYPKGWPTYSG